MLSRIAVRIHQWRHAGEENAVAIYAGRWKTPLRKGIAAIVFAILLLEPDRDVLRILIPSFTAIFVACANPRSAQSHYIYRRHDGVPSGVRGTACRRISEDCGGTARYGELGPQR
jgi:hypothetical protein